ncbi:MAG: type II secretion system F family protein, partial [Gammaproteobacteria bacterium]
MPAYQYKAVTEDGRIVNGRMEAASDADLEMRLDHMGMALIHSRLHRSRGLLQRHRVRRRDLIHFTFHLEQLVGAGVPLLEGLADLRDTTDNDTFRDVISMLIQDIEGGKTFSEALAAHPRIFDTVYVNLVQAGERSGRLQEVLLQLESGLKWQDELAARTRKVLLYPAFVALVVTGAVLFLMLYLVPQLVQFIQSMGEGLPLHARALIATSNFMVAWWPVLLGAFPAFLVTLTLLRRHSPRAARWIDRLALALWPVGPIVKK